MTGNRALMCTGEIAKKPFYLDKIYVNVYTIEELCYEIYENAFLIDKDFVSRPLAEWIDKECKLPELARDLYALVNQNALAVSFVGTILDYVGYYSHDEIEKVESILKLNVTMNVFEKWKAKADFLFENRHYLLAIREYEHVLENIGEDDLALRSKIYNNMGVTYMALYLFESALECFKKAYEIDNNETAYKHLLKAKRLQLSEDEYIRFIAEEEEAYRMSIPIESEYEQVKAEFEESDKARHMRELFELKDQKDAALYYEEMSRMTEQLKADYRDIVLEAEQIGM